VRTPSLYNHMRSKHELLRTIVDRTTAGVLADFHTAVDDLTDPVERLRRASLVYALRHATHRREAIVVNRDTASLESRAAPSCRTDAASTSTPSARSSATARPPASSRWTPPPWPRSRSGRCA
jgi:AcrR family transcriptional regulator